MMSTRCDRRAELTRTTRSHNEANAQRLTPRLMVRVQAQSGAWQREMRLLSIVAVLLIAFGAIVQVTHHHNDARTTHPDCALCLVAHTRIVAPAVVALPVRERHFVEMESFRLETPRTTPVVFVYSRPPPAQAALS